MIRTKWDTCKWETFKNWFNRLPEGYVLSRKELKLLVDENISYPTTIDSYRRMCEVAGYIKKGDKPGHFVKVKNLLLFAFKNDIKEEAYGYRNHSNNLWWRNGTIFDRLVMNN